MKLSWLVLSLFLASVGPIKLPEPLTFKDETRTRVTLDEPGVLYLVDFWAEDVKACRDELPELELLAAKYEPAGRFKLISVLWGGSQGADLATLAKRHNVQRSFYSDPDGWFLRLEAKVFPTKFLVRDGEVLYRVHGGGPGAYARWSKVLEAELADH